MRRVLIPTFAGVIVLAVTGLVTGVIGATVRGGSPILPAPEIHLAPQVIFHLGAFGVTNTLLSAWLTTGVLVLLFGLGTRKMRVIPQGLQNLLEVIIEQLYNFGVGVVGASYGRKVFPIIATLFLFVVFNSWIALLPIYPSVGIMGMDGQIETHLLRSAGTDLNLPIALALVSFLLVEYWGLRAHGLSYFSEFFRYKTLAKGVRRLSPGLIFMGGIDVFVGLLELLSHFVRVVSFSFRLFGNMTAGEILLLMATFLVSFVVSVVFYGLELLVGVVQALIFAGLTLAFIQVAVTPHEEENSKH